MAAVILLNLYFFARTIVVVHSMSIRRKSAEESEVYAKTKRALLASGSFFSVMGLGWVFGVRSTFNVAMLSSSDVCI